MTENLVQKILDKLEALKAEVETVFHDLGLGVDQVNRAHEGLDVAKSAVASHPPVVEEAVEVEQPKALEFGDAAEASAKSKPKPAPKSAK